MTDAPKPAREGDAITDTDSENAESSSVSGVIGVPPLPPALGRLPPPPPPAAAFAAPPRPPPPAAAFVAPPPPSPPPQAPSSTVDDVPSPRASALSLTDFELEELPIPVPSTAAQATDSAANRSTMEFLFELDTPFRATSTEIDLEAEPDLAAALAEAGVRRLVEQEPSAAPDIELLQRRAVSEPPPDSTILSIEIGTLLPASDRPRTAEEQHEHRLRRVIARIQMCRDAFRVLGVAGLQDADRKAMARLFMTLDAAAGPRKGKQGLTKDPAPVLKDATKEQLDAIEPLIGPIEEQLLQLDGTVTRAAFEQCLGNGKVTKKLLVRYGRLLATRRFRADERRNRFERIAMLLLTTTDTTGFRHVLSPEAARPVLSRLIGDLPHKVKEAELHEAIEHLRTSIGRVREFATAQEFFASDFYSSVHGYKVTMRDQLPVPEFLYFSLALNVAVHNRVESFICQEELQHGGEAASGSVREQILHGLRAQEDMVDEALGASRRTGSQILSRGEPPPKTAEAEAPTPKPKKKAKPKKRVLPSFSIGIDRNLMAIVVSVVVILGVGTLALTRTGVVGAPSVQALTTDYLHKVSPVLERGWIKGEDEKRWLHGFVSPHRWQKLSARDRRKTADAVVSALGTRGIKTARIYEGTEMAIEIADGFVVKVSGGKL